VLVERAVVPLDPSHKRHRLPLQDDVCSSLRR
jgi:hypothetical protein